MSLTLYFHPFSSYCQKAITALYEKGLAFEAKLLDNSEPVKSEFAALWPIGKFPVLVDRGQLVFEATGIIEHLEAIAPDSHRLIPTDALQAAEVRMWDRFFDNYIGYPQQRLVYAAIGREVDDGGAKWKAALDTAYTFLDNRMAGREWAAANQFSLAHWTHPIGEQFRNLWAYRDRLLARPSYARALNEARPYRHYFPLGAPVGRD